MSSSSLCVISGDHLLTRILAEHCAPSGVQVRVAKTIPAAWKEIGRGQIDFLLLDLASLGAGVVEICRELAFDTALPNVPTLILTGTGPHQQTWQVLCQSLGFPTHSLATLGWCGLMNEICNAMQVPSFTGRIQRSNAIRHYGRILCLDHHRQFSRELQMRMREHGITVSREFNAVDGFRVAAKTRPDAIITEFLLPKGSGSWVLGRLLDCGISIPTLFVMEGDPAAFPNLKTQLLDLGAAAVLHKPVPFDRILQELSRVIHIPTITQTTLPPTKTVHEHHREDQPEAAMPHIRFGEVARTSNTEKQTRSHQTMPAPHTSRHAYRAGSRRQHRTP